MEILKKMNLSDRRNLYVLLGVSIAVLSIGLAFLSNGSRPSSDIIISPTNSTPDNILQSNSSMQENFQLSTDTIPGKRSRIKCVFPNRRCSGSGQSLYSF